MRRRDKSRSRSRTKIATPSKLRMDGSSQALAVAAAAATLAGRAAAEVRTVAARGVPLLDREALGALVDPSHAADVVIVGGRGLRGFVWSPTMCPREGDADGS